MPLAEDISAIKQRRQGLHIWLIQNELTFTALAECIGIRLPTLDAHLKNPTIPVEHHRKLVETFNVPPELLPEPRDLRPGPKPKLSSTPFPA